MKQKLEKETGNGNWNKNTPITGAMVSSWTHEQHILLSNGDMTGFALP